MTIEEGDDNEMEVATPLLTDIGPLTTTNRLIKEELKVLDTK